MDELPAQIGPYEVRDRLGHGGMGVVYLGYDPMLDRAVAIKVLKVPDDETRRRFLREARLAARVHHPHIVSIYAVGEHEGNPYLAMEFIAGRTLSQVIRGGEPVPLARKVHWLSELCAGLGHAHQSGIVHRDVKPSNLLIAQSSGTLRLLDFGIAHGNEASGMTMAGMIVGTPQYMSPEQITGQAVDARSDIFSVGAVAYELLTGRQAFAGDNLYHVSRLVVSEQPVPIESIVPDVPTALVRTIARCLQKDPATRADNAKTLEREFLALARRLDPEHTLVVLPADPTMLAPGRDLTTSRKAMLREAEDAIAQGELTVASGLLQKLESGTSPNPDVQQLRQKLQARRMELRVNEALGRAEDAVHGGSIEEAETAIVALAEVSPRHEALERLRTALQDRIDERQVATLTSRARLALQQDRLDDAEAIVAEALALAPAASDVLALQQKVGERTRAQRISRLVTQASRALEQDDKVAAGKAIDALAKVDPTHGDVARLRARLAALASDSAEHALKGATPAPRPAAAAPAAHARSGPAPAASPARAHAPAGDAPLRRASAPDPGTETRPASAPATTEASSSRTPMLVAAALVALVGLAGGAWWALRTPSAEGPPSVVASPTDADPAAEKDIPSASTSPPPAEPEASTEAPPPPLDSETAAPTNDPAAPSTPGDPWGGVRQLAAAGRFDRAMNAIDQVRGVSATQAQAERQRVIELARRQTLAARRGAEDLRLTARPQYILGMSRQAEADREQKAGRLKSAVSGYMLARTHFLQAFSGGGAPAPDATTAEATPPSTTATPATPAGATPAPPAAPAVDLSTWSNEEARATIAQFCGAFLARDLGGLGRLWPLMDAGWRAEFREAFATDGELVCVFESVTIVRTSEEFNATTRLLTQLPGGAQRRRNLAITLVPARDRLVIGNIRVR